MKTTPNTKREEKKEYEKLLEEALRAILWIANKKNPHLGHPRLTDRDCIFCIGYFALKENNGSFGYTVDVDFYKKIIDDIKSLVNYRKDIY